MRRKTWIGIVFAVACVLVSASFATANIRMHDFDCKECHSSALAVNSVDNNVCLKCHNGTLPAVYSFADPARNGGRPHTAFTGGDASDALGSVTAKGLTPGNQTSHFWAGTATKPKAGAQEPTSFFSAVLQRPLSYSRGSVTCSRCHDPHGYYDTNPKLLMSTSLSTPTKEPLCLDCHRAWNSATTHGITTHPMNVDLAAAAASFPNKYKSTPDNSNVTNGNVTLVNGKVSCSSCHGVHGVDSDASTADGIGTSNTGDGLLLKHNGPGKETPDTSICQSCHKYKGHGNVANGTPLGCLTCHGGHEYDPNGQPNVYMLKKQITLDTTKIKSTGSVNDTITLDYTTYPPAPNFDNGGGNGSLCLSCHDFPAGHQAGATCSDCHSHDNQNGTFAASCGSCHGYAPSLNAPGDTNQGGYAKSTQTTNDYSASGVFKDESTTPHATHANGAGNYSYGCTVCHGDASGQLGSADHDAGTFQQVMDAAVGTLDPLTTNNGATAPTYTATGSGTCNATYCHSNGAPIGGVAFQPVSVSWANGKGTIFTPTNTTDNECQQCHGNTAATMSGKDSALHQQHLGAGTMLGKTFDCSVCHSTVAVSNTELQSTAIGGDHVNGTKDVSFDGSFSLGAGTLGGGSYGAATCSVYCHSNGKVGGESSPSWTNAASGQCGTCHQVNATGDTGAALTGAHAKHLFDANGPQLSCDDCHGANAAVGKHANHINGAIDAPAQSVCDACHGATAGQTTGPDREPIWTDATSVDCETCHTGSAIAVVKGKTAPAQNSFGTLGHGKASITGPTCTGCHDTSAGKHFDATSGDPQLTGGAGVVADDAFCQTCHATKSVHYANSATAGGNSTDANSCFYCHEPHGNGVGTGFDAMILSSVGPTGNKAAKAVTGFTDRTSKNSYQNANFAGICQVCHDATDGSGGAIKHYNRGLDETTHNGPNPCISCHNHDATVAFQPGAGTACNNCHGTATSNAPATGAHLAHTNFQSSDKANAAFDATDCDVCHTDVYSGPGDGTGTLQYSYDPSVDQANGFNHSSKTGRDSQLMAAVGFDPVNKTCSNACHQGPSGKTAKWTDTSIGCDACHYYAATPTSAANNAAGVTKLGGTHNQHFDANAVCTDCHADNTADNSAKRTHITTQTGVKDAVAIQGRAQALQDEATITPAALGTAGNDPDPGNPTCNNVACHNPSDDGTHQATWATTTATCDTCHSSTDPGTGSHTQHLAASVPTTFGKTISCVDCHGDTTAGGTNMAHRNGTKDFAAGVVFTSPTCSAAVCHNDGTGTAKTTPNWGRTPSSADDCTICHAAPPVTGKHAKHVANNTFVVNSCDECHGVSAETKSTHIDGTVNIGNRVTAYTGGTTNTCTNACHIANTNGDWTASGSLACADCHGSGKNTTGFAQGGAALDRGWPPSAETAHAPHVNNTAYVSANCVDCHNDNTGGHSAINGTATSPTLGAKISAYDSTTHTCTNTCHAGSAGVTGSPDFLDSNPSPGCTDCHSGTYIAGDNTGTGGSNFLPQSGLHTGTLTVSGNTHDDSFKATRNEATPSGTCITCHTTTPSSAHENGTFDASIGSDAGAGQKINLVSAVNFTDGVTPTCGPSGALSSCHDDGGAWARKWSTTAQNSDGTECQNCHGVFGSWASGISKRHSDDPQLQANHADGTGTQKCYLCHAYGDTAYDVATMHRDGKVQINNANNNTGFQDNGASVGCANCHSATDNSNFGNGQHEFQDTWNGDAVADGGLDRWGRSFVDGPVGDCTSCHTANGMTHTGTNESASTHDLHVNSGFISSCTECHPHAGSGPLHNNGTVNFGGTYLTAADYAKTGNFGGTCASTNGCHDSQSGEWAAGNLGANSCQDCHGSANASFFENQIPGTPNLTWQTSPVAGPTTNKHAAHLSKANYVSDCSACHPHNGSGAQHRDKAIELNTSVVYNSTDGTCTNNCHAVASGRDWNDPNVTGLELACTDCHTSGKNLDAGGDAWTSVDTADGKHGTHAGAYTYGATGETATGPGNTYDFGCGECHNGTHLNSTYAAISAGTAAEVTVPNWNGTAKTCGTNACHQDGKGGAPAFSPTWGTPFNGDRCAKCHGNAPATGAHSVHTVGIHSGDIYTGTTGKLAAGGTEPSAHGGRMTDGVSPTSTVINCQVCHFSTVTDWNNDQKADCAACHDGTNAALQGNVTIAQRQNHVTGSTDDGKAEVSFVTAPIRTKAQLRDDIETVPEVGNNWNRKKDGVLQTLLSLFSDGYKTANAYDETAQPLSTGTFTAGATPTCTVACHNGNQASWTTPAGDCAACHKQLPK